MGTSISLQRLDNFIIIFSDEICLVYEHNNIKTHIRLPSISVVSQHDNFTYFGPETEIMGIHFI